MQISSPLLVDFTLLRIITCDVCKYRTTTKKCAIVWILLCWMVKSYVRSFCVERWNLTLDPSVFNDEVLVATYLHYWLFLCKYTNNSGTVTSDCCSINNLSTGNSRCNSTNAEGYYQPTVWWPLTFTCYPGETSHEILVTKRKEKMDTWCFTRHTLSSQSQVYANSWCSGRNYACLSEYSSVINSQLLECDQQIMWCFKKKPEWILIFTSTLCKTNI